MSATLKKLFGTGKPVVGMAHFAPLPGSPLYDDKKGVPGVASQVHQDVLALQKGGIDGILFANEGDRPYELRVGFETVACMATVISEIRGEIEVPFGVDVLWDPEATLALAKATGARFVREVFTNAYAGDPGLWQTDCASALRYRKAIDAQQVRLFFNINAEFAACLAPRPLGILVRSAIFSSLPDAICISGSMTGEPVELGHLEEAKAAAGSVPVLANTGTTLENLGDVLRVADGCVVGTTLKREGVTWNPVDVTRVSRLMDRAREVRGEF